MKIVNNVAGNQVNKTGKRPYLCKDCRWFDRFKKSNRGLCREDSPFLTTSNDAVWPQVYDVDWCGHFQMRGAV